MEIYSYEDMKRLQTTNWWYAARRDLFRRMLQTAPRPFRRALDLGCGVGSNADALVAEGRVLTGLDASDEALARARETQRYANLIKSEAETIPLETNSMDLILSADVLEHVDDARAVAEAFRVLAPGGWLIVTVPAHRWLWNWNDDYSHHLRRYEAHEVRTLLEQAGFSVKKLTSWNLTFVLPVLLMSRLERLRKKPEMFQNNLNAVPPFLNAFLTWLLGIESRISLFVGLPTGVSLYAIAEKPILSDEPALSPQLEHQQRPQLFPSVSSSR